MHKLLRFYSQNRLKIWATILGIIFILVVIQVLNSISRNQMEEQNRNILEQETTLSNVVSYDNQSETILSDENVPEQYRDDFGNLIEQFFTYCTNHEPRRAYNLLAQETIDVLYPTEEIFERSYCAEKFDGDKDFSFQSWIKSGDLYIYQVKIFDNMLATGISNDTYYEDYVTITPENGEYKLNINSLVGVKNINQNYNNDQLDITIRESQVFMNYEIYSFEIKNKTDKTILLDSREKTDTTYVTDDLNNQYSSLLYENNEEDLIIAPGETKTISIRFSDVYREGIVISQMTFGDIILDYEAYENGEDPQRITFEMEF